MCFLKPYESSTTTNPVLCITAGGWQGKNRPLRNRISSFSQPSVGRGRNSLKRGCQLSELRKWGFVTVGLQLQLVCCAWVSSLGVLNLYSHLEPIRGEWRTSAPTWQYWVSPRELQGFGDDRVNRYSAHLGMNHIDSEVMTKWWSMTRGRWQV